MIKRKHKQYSLKRLREGISCNMVDGRVNPNKSEYSDEFELGIDVKKHNKKNRWTIDAYRDDIKTPKLRNSDEY